VFTASERAEILRNSALNRGQGLKDKWLSMHGRAMDTNETALSLKISASNVNNLRHNKGLLGLKHEGKYLYPSWQIDDEGQILRGLGLVLLELDNTVASDWTKMMFFVQPNEHLIALLGGNHRTPVEALRDGYFAEVVEAAKTYLSHGG
jgi:hypothetical protein